MVRLCGATLGLLAFGVTILLGMLAGNPTESVLLRAIWAMFMFCGIGLSVGWVAYRIIDDYALGLRREMWPEELDEGQATGVNQAGSEAEGEVPPAARD